MLATLFATLQTVRLDVNYVQLEFGFDFLRVYDGPNDSAMLLAELTGNYNTTMSYVTTQYQMFVKFTSDSSVVYQGFIAYYTTGE